MPRKYNKNKEWFVEGIVGIRYNFDEDCAQFQVKWRGYRRQTWEPFCHVKDLACLSGEMIQMSKKLTEQFSEPAETQQPQASPAPQAPQEEIEVEFAIEEPVAFY